MTISRNAFWKPHRLQEGVRTSFGDSRAFFLWQARKYIVDSMGESYAEGVILDLEKTWEESDPRTPLVCLLSMGSDPTDSIIALGKRLKTETRFVSLGQGQEAHARKLLQQTMANVRTSVGFRVLWFTFQVLGCSVAGDSWIEKSFNLCTACCLLSGTSIPMR